MSGVKGIDTSHWQGVPSEQQINCLWDAGFRFWIVGLQVPSIFIPSIERIAAQRRWRIEGYEYLYQSPARGGPPSRQITDSIAQLQSANVAQHVKRIWLDYEDGGEVFGDGEVEQAIQLANYCASHGFPSGLYSSEGWLTRNVTTAGLRKLSAALALWLADWDGIPGDTSHPWPSWWPLHTKQYSGDQGGLCGITIDANWRPQAVWDAERDDDMPTLDELAQLILNGSPEQREYLNAVLMGGKIPIYPLPPDQHPLLGDVLHKAFYAEPSTDGSGDGITEAEVQAIVDETIAGSTLTPPGGN